MFLLLSTADIKQLAKGDLGSDFDALLQSFIIPHVSQLLATYCKRDDFDLKSRTELFSPRENQRRLFLKSPPVAERFSLRTTALKWTASSVGTATYYCDLASGGNPSLTNPVIVLENGVEMARGSSIATLSAGQFAYGNGDSLGFNTVYVRLSDGTDPDSKAVDYLEANPIRVYQNSDSPRIFDSTTILTKDSDYFLDEETGIVERPEWNWFTRGTQTVKVVYPGGYVTADGQNVPPELKAAALYQAKIFFDRREEISVTSRALEGGSISLLPLTLPRTITDNLTRFVVPQYC